MSTTPKIILTDWPKLKHIEAYYRGLTDDKLLALRSELFNGMMCAITEHYGGYAISYEYKAVEAELRFRKVIK